MTPENREILVQSLRRQAVELIEGQHIPTLSEKPLFEGTLSLDKFCISEFESGPALFFRFSKTGENRKTSIYNIRSDLAFEDQAVFLPCNLFDHGRLCLGYTEDTMVVHRVQDWSLVVRLETDPNDTWLDSSKAGRIWTAVGPDSDLLLCIHLRDDSAGIVEVWDITVNTSKGTIQHPGISTWASLPGSKFLTADKNGNARIWDMCHLTYKNFPIDLGTGLVAIGCYGNILEYIDEHLNSKYYHLRNELLPPRLQGTSKSPDFWVTFSDGTYVLGDLNASGGYFSIFSPEGKQQGSFQHDSTKNIITFMDF
jgi:hypothetical protein